MHRELALLQEKIHSNKQTAEDIMNQRLKYEKDLLLLDQDQDRVAYQHLLKEYHELEQNYEKLKQQIVHLIPDNLRSLSNDSSTYGLDAVSEQARDNENIVSLFYAILFIHTVLNLN